MVLILGCASPGGSRKPGLVAPKWQDGEVSVYRVSRTDSSVFRIRTELHFDEEFGTPTAVVTTTLEPVAARVLLFDSASVVFERQTLRPLRSYSSVETEFGSFEVETRYEKGRALIRKQSVDGVQEQGIRIPAGSYDNEMVRTMLRAVPLETGRDFRFDAVVPIDFRVVATDVKVLGTKFVQTQAGVGVPQQVACREVLLSTPKRQLRLWYEIAEPHRLIGLADPDGETEMLLESYEPGQAAGAQR